MHTGKIRRKGEREVERKGEGGTERKEGQFEWEEEGWVTSLLEFKSGIIILQNGKR